MITIDVNTNLNNAADDMEDLVQGLPTQEQYDYWYGHADMISVSTLDENMDKAMDRLSALKKDENFMAAYIRMSPDEMALFTLKLIAAEDLKTLQEIAAYNNVVA